MKGISRLQPPGAAPYVGLVVTATAASSEFDAMSSGRFRVNRATTTHAWRRDRWFESGSLQGRVYEPSVDSPGLNAADWSTDRSRRHRRA